MITITQKSIFLGILLLIAMIACSKKDNKQIDGQDDSAVFFSTTIDTVYDSEWKRKTIQYSSVHGFQMRFPIEWHLDDGTLKNANPGKGSYSFYLFSYLPDTVSNPGLPVQRENLKVKGTLHVETSMTPANVIRSIGNVDSIKSISAGNFEAIKIWYKEPEFGFPMVKIVVGMEEKWIEFIYWPYNSVHTLDFDSTLRRVRFTGHFDQAK